MPESITAARLDEIIAAFNNHDADAVISFFAPEGVMLSPAGKEAVGTTLRGRDTIRAALAKRFADCPDIQWTEGKNWIFGNKALSEWRVRGTTPGGEIIDTIGCDLWEFEDGLIVKKDTYYKQKT